MGELNHSVVCAGLSEMNLASREIAQGLIKVANPKLHVTARIRSAEAYTLAIQGGASEKEARAAGYNAGIGVILEHFFPDAQTNINYFFKLPVLL